MSLDLLWSVIIKESVFFSVTPSFLFIVLLWGSAPSHFTHLFSSVSYFFSFLVAFYIFPLLWIVCFHVFFCSHCHAGLWLAAVCYVAPRATNLTSGVSPAVGGSLWSLGLGSAPSGPPPAGRLHRSISWAGTVHHMCDHTFPPQKSPGVLYFFTLAQFSCESDIRS